MSLLASLHDWLTAQHLDAMLLSSWQNEQPHMRISSSSGSVFINHESVHILVDARYYTDVAMRTQGYQIHLLGGTQTLYSQVNHIIANEKLQTVEFEGEQVSWETANTQLGRLCARLVSAVPDIFRQVKTAQEIACIREACRIADLSATHIHRFIQPGLSECEIAAELGQFMRTSGADRASFDTIVVSGWRGALSHGKASDKRVEAGEFITLDLGAQYQGYCSGMTRTFRIPGVNLPAEESALFAVYQIAPTTQRAAVAAIRPGACCNEVDATARRVIMQAGYGDAFGHSIGHAIGTEVHGNPRSSPNDATTLAAGMLLTVEPGTYLSGQGGVHVEDVVLVTSDGGEVLYIMVKTLLHTGEAQWTYRY